MLIVAINCLQVHAYTRSTLVNKSEPYESFRDIATYEKAASGFKKSDESDTLSEMSALTPTVVQGENAAQNAM
jgi:hypothetical protein